MADVSDDISEWKTEEDFQIDVQNYLEINLVEKQEEIDILEETEETNRTAGSEKTKYEHNLETKNTEVGLTINNGNVEVNPTEPARTNDQDQIVIDDEVEDQIEIKDREEIIDVDQIVIDDEEQEGTDEDQIEIINDDQIEVVDVDSTETADNDKIEIINVDPTETVDDDQIQILSDEKTVPSKAREIELKRRKEQSCVKLKFSKTKTQEEKKTEAESKTVNTILDNSTEKVVLVTVNYKIRRKSGEENPVQFSLFIDKSANQDEKSTKSPRVFQNLSNMAASSSPSSLQTNTKLECECCGKKFKSMQNLTGHVTKNLCKFKCTQCTYTSNVKYNLRTHFQTEHTRGPVFFCSHCTSSFNTLQLKQVHEYINHPKERPVRERCGKCYRKYGTKKSLQKHKLICANRPSYKCDLCDFNTLKFTHLKKHMRTRHKFDLLFSDLEKYRVPLLKPGGLSRNPGHEILLVKQTSEDPTKEDDFEETTVNANYEAVNEESDEEEEMVSKKSEVARKEDDSKEALVPKDSEEIRNKDDSDKEKVTIQITPICKIQQIETEKRRKSFSALPQTDLADSQRKEARSAFSNRLFVTSDKFQIKCSEKSNSNKSGSKTGLAPVATFTTGHYDQPPQEISLETEENIDAKDADDDGPKSSNRSAVYVCPYDKLMFKAVNQFHVHLHAFHLDMESTDVRCPIGKDNFTCTCGVHVNCRQSYISHKSRCTGETIFEDESDTDKDDEDEVFILEDDEDQATKHIKNSSQTSEDKNMEPKLTEEVLFICDKTISYLRNDKEKSAEAVLMEQPPSVAATTVEEEEEEEEAVIEILDDEDSSNSDCIQISDDGSDSEIISLDNPELKPKKSRKRVRQIRCSMCGLCYSVKNIFSHVCGTPEHMMY